MADKKQTDLVLSEENVQVSEPELEVAAGNSCCDILEKLEIEAPEILSELSVDKRKKLIGIVAARYEMQSHSGPLPRPEDIALYNEHIPDGANRIMTMAEEQAKHRQGMERKMVEGAINQSGTGQKFALVIGITGIVAGTIVTLMGHDVVGGGIAGATVISLVYAFITGQRAQKDEPGDEASSCGEE